MRILQNQLCYITLFLVLLSGCAERTRPAPVVSLGGSVPTNSTSKNTINGVTYEVKLGETLYSIAWRSGNDVRTIAKINNLKAPYKIYPKQILRLTPKISKSSTSKQVSVQTPKTDVNKKLKVSVKTVAKKSSQEYGVKNGGKFSSVKVPSLTQKVSNWTWPVKGRIVSKFSNTAKGNKGLDISGKHGQPIKASAGGLVVYAGNALRGYGNLIIIKHNDDYLSAYAHNDILLVKEQQTIKTGQVIAKMGSSGTDRTMLHFEIRFRGKSVDPMRYLPK